MAIRSLTALTITALAVTQIATVAPAATQAQLNKRLQGTYHSVNADGCVTSPLGFGPAPQLAALGPTTTSTVSVEATTVYKGDGTFTVTGARALAITHSSLDPTTPTSFPVTKATLSCTGTYQVNPDNSFTSSSDCTGTVDLGEAPGSQFTLNGLVGKGKIVGSVLIGSSVEGNVETVGTPAGTAYRICRRSTTSRKSGAAGDEA